jgi:VanZ family protein
MLAARRRVRAWLPVIGWAMLIFAFSAQPNLRFLPDDSLDFVVRKVGHAGVFGVLALLLWFAVAATTSRRRPWAWALALAWAYAATDELHQAFVAGRHAALTDVAIDAAGALVAVAAVAGLRVLLRRNRSRRAARASG